MTMRDMRPFHLLVCLLSDLRDAHLAEITQRRQQPVHAGQQLPVNSCESFTTRRGRTNSSTCHQYRLRVAEHAVRQSPKANQDPESKRV